MSRIREIEVINGPQEPIPINTGPQEPLPISADSVYAKDIDIANSNNGIFTGYITDYFNSLISVNSNHSPDNPKVITIKFNRSIQTSAIGLGCDDDTEDFSNVKIKLLGSAEEIRQTVDNSTDNTKRNSFVAQFTPDTANGIILEFHTADDVGLSNIIIYKSINTNSSISAVSALTGTVENIESFRGALKVTDGFVHRAIVNEFFTRDVGPSTTLSVVALVGASSITVADSTGFIIGDLIKVGILATQILNIRTITNVVGNVITLDRRFCNERPIGTVVKEVENDMTSLVGTLAAPIAYDLAPPVGVIWQITRLLITMADNLAMDDGKFGGLTALTNGVSVVANTSAGRCINITNWKANGDIMLDMYDVEYNSKAPAGEYGLRAKWLLTESAIIAELNGDNSEFMRLLIQDDITANTSFRIKAQGRVFGA